MIDAARNIDPNFRAGLFSQSSNRILNGRFGFFPIRIRLPIT
jgi:hypothetical protein